MTTMTIVKGDRRPSQTEVLRQQTGPYDLTAGSTTVRFRVWDDAGTMLIDAAAVIVDAANGKVRWDPGVAETNIGPGTFKRRWRIMDGGTLQAHVPNDGWDTLEVLDDSP